MGTYLAVLQLTLWDIKAFCGLPWNSIPFYGTVSVGKLILNSRSLPCPYYCKCPYIKAQNCVSSTFNEKRNFFQETKIIFQIQDNIVQ